MTALTDEWAWGQVRLARRNGVSSREQYDTNLDAAQAFYREELRRVWSRRHDFSDSVRKYVRHLREIEFLRGWLATAAIEDDTTAYFRWQLDRVQFPVLLNSQGAAVARLCRSPRGRGFCWEIFRNPCRLGGASWEFLRPDGAEVLCAGEAPRRAATVMMLLRELDGKSIALFGVDRLDIPDISFDGRWWKEVA